MKVFAVQEYKPLGDLSALQECDVPIPMATGKDLLIKVKAVSTNPIDYKWLSNMGDYEQPLKTDHLIAGYDASGTVEAVGSDVSLFQVGDSVYFAGDLFRPGAFGEYVLVDERIVAKKPESLSWSQAAAESLTSLTAWEALIDQLKVSTDPKTNIGKTILITGGAGGTATAATQLAAKVFGLQVIATASRPETIAYIKKMGASNVINHHKNMKEQLTELGITEVDYVMHNHDLTPTIFTELIDIVKPFGGICAISISATVDLMQLFWKSISFSAEFMFTRPALRSNESLRQHKILTDVAMLLDAGIIAARENVTAPLTLESLRHALELQATGSVIGKTTLYFED